MVELPDQDPTPERIARTMRELEGELARFFDELRQFRESLSQDEQHLLDSLVISAYGRYADPNQDFKAYWTTSGREEITQGFDWWAESPWGLAYRAQPNRTSGN